MAVVCSQCTTEVCVVDAMILRVCVDVASLEQWGDLDSHRLTSSVATQKTSFVFVSGVTSRLQVPARPPDRPVNNRQYTHKHPACLTIDSYRGEFTYNGIESVTTIKLYLRPFGTTFSFVFPCSPIS